MLLAFPLVSLLFPQVASKFSFNHTALTQCGDLTVTWEGGSGAGYYLSIIPVRLTSMFPRNISIPASAFVDGKGSFSVQSLPFNASDPLVLTMSDSSGFGAGGTTPLLETGKSLGASCNTSTLGAVAPVTIFGVIPGGDSFVLNPPPNARTFEWLANVYNGTQIIFLMVDADLRPGGSVLAIVALSGDSSCIDAQSPSSTISPNPSSTQSGPPSVPATPRSPVGAIAGSVLGALIFLAVLITLGLFFLRQNQNKKRGSSTPYRRNSRPLDESESDLQYSSQHASNLGPYSGANTPTSSGYFNSSGSQSHPVPPVFPQGTAHPPAHYQEHSPYLAPSQVQFDGADIDPFLDQATNAPSTSRRKSGMTAYSNYTPSRFIVHTDAEDEIPPNADGVVELPPQYSATHGKYTPASTSGPPTL
ncbi:hypothetical protein C8J57DRAFT_1269226 [Mycena rebaudengoi]|nr:hypothetical protein C8J57DRAFT_1269226 [Mycena rebaudengoi]